MKGPASLIRAETLPGLKRLDPLFQWQADGGYLTLEYVRFEGKAGGILCYYNPPVHQVGNPGLDAYLEGLERVGILCGDLEFLILCGANDPVHAGGDLKESLRNLDRTLKAQREMETAAADTEDVDRLFDWADGRLRKGHRLHRSLRALARDLRLIAVCGGGTRFGGSAEIPLMADYVLGDSRSAMCFSEAMIGLIPGWAGIARVLVKAGLANAAYMAKTCRVVRARELVEIGIYNAVVDVPFGFPEKPRTGNPEADRTAYREALQEHDQETGRLLLPEALKWAVGPLEEIPVLPPQRRRILARPEEIAQEVNRRRDPERYAGLFGRPLREVREAVGRLGRPLAPQSIEALEGLLEGFDPESFDEAAFVEAEMEADARLYRDPRLRAGLVATLEQTVADYRL